ncbi:hypothetical protein HR45_14165 [Shewanella mangrovi]|uniref:Uncharacterized protein n=1 Tax=Shewanella mangrovi TaxID=1515746 RepID=A0A094JFF7_9GAMM|nr:DUF523 domain-containing protein [Shewanella mangrovi]KFZ36764.1 hypothetical protein HR45_14165 [Shewanella mangrovi]
MSRAKVLVSACLLGQRVRYDGGDNRLQHPLLTQLSHEQRIVPFCPECAGGLATPREPAEQRGTQVITRSGRDVTAEFHRGAELALQVAQQHDVVMALLKARSPSCGVGSIYDGQFQRQLIAGNGVTAARLQAAGIKTFSEEQLAQASAWLAVYDAAAES